MSGFKASDNSKRFVIAVRRTEYTYKDKKLGKRVTLVKDFPKTDSVRDIIIPEHAQQIIDKIISMNPDGEYLFMQNGKRITGRMFNYYLHKACMEIGIKQRSTHKIRKTYASMLLANNIDESIVLNQMGHKDISTTQSYYHYNIADDKTQYEKINAVMNF